MRVGLGYDIHPFGRGPLVLGGVTIDAPGLEGHSDADALAHAIADSLLGPAGLPDLGTLYPSSDERLANASSMDLLRDVAGRVADAGWSVANVDVVVAAEQPKLAPHLAAMRANVLSALGPAGGETHVAIRPKHGEGIGAIGRGEGIAVWAVALLEQSMRA